MGEHGAVNTTLRIAPRFCGPPGTGNGGYSAGRIAAAVGAIAGDEAVEVTLRAPIPIERDLVVTTDPSSGGIVVRDGDRDVATARRLPFRLELPEPVSWEAAERVVREAPLRGFIDEHPFPGCFVCGPDRHPGDGMRLFAARVPGTPYFAVPWEVADAGAEFVWAALDCPSSFPMYLAEDPFPGPCVLGRIAARIERVPEPGERAVVMSWREQVDGRKLHTASAVFAETGGVIGSARSTWIRVAPSP